MVDLSSLNNEQKEAVVTTEGYVRVIASPGSGKTRALTHRYAYLLDDKKISGDNILCITYTNKAANEMKERIIKLVNSEENSFENISTIHSYCDKLLRKNINLLNGNFDNDYIIFDEDSLEKLLKKLGDKYPDIEGVKPSELKKELAEVKNKNQDYVEYLFGLKEYFSFQIDWIDELLEISKAHKSLFFDDLIYGSLFLLRKYDDLKKKEQKRFKYIMVDEFQDTTPNTYELVKILADYHKNLFIVGDPDQSIYEFIGANPNILLKQFEEDFPSLKTLLMNTNYRSTNKIIELSNQLIEHNVNRFDQKKTIGFNNIEGSTVVYQHYLDNKNQAYNVCRLVDYLHNELKYDYKDIFVIGRNHHHFSDIKKAFIQNEIPYVNSRHSTKLMEKEEIKLINYYLTYAINQSGFALYNINEIVDLGIDNQKMEKVLYVKTNIDEFLTKNTNKKIKAFIASNEHIKEAILLKTKPSKIVEMIVGEYGILSRYQPDLSTGYFKEAERISQLIQGVQYNEKINPNYSIFDFVSNLALESSISNGNEKDAVVLMTAHGSKGLESKNVIVINYNGISGGEDERRLSYVAFTRAKENLFILSAKKSGESFFAEEFKDLTISVDEYFENIKLSKPDYDMNKDIKDLNEEKKKAFELLVSGKNVFLTGEAGTGKTYLIDKYLSYLRKNGKTFMICAPTGIAAANYTGGITIHKAFGIYTVPSVISLKKPLSTAGIRNIDTIIIDEISMCRIDIFDYIMRVINKCNQKRDTPIQVVLCGDFFQLPPVILDSEKEILKQLFPGFVEGFAFESNEWKKANFENVILKEIFRQKDDLPFVNALNNARRGIDIENSIKYINEHCSKDPIENAMEIHSRNAMVNKINTDMLNKIPTKEVVYKAKYEGIITEGVNVEDTIILKPGCRVMMLVNEANLRYQNGSLGTVITCGKNYIDVVTDKNKEVVRIYESDFSYLDKPVLDPNGEIIQEVVGNVTQIPVKLAYAITIHKSQGQTYERVNLDPSGWESGQIYVAISRIKGIGGLYLYKEISKDVLKTSKNVIEFYNNLLL